MGRDIFHSPIGTFEIVTCDGALVSIAAVSQMGGPKQVNLNLSPDRLTDEVKRQLDMYFEGKLKDFDLPIKFNGKGFCLKVWENIRRIPYGKTITYGSLAFMSGSPKAYRSAGSCTGKNPIPIVVPCHRVVAKNGQGRFGLGPKAKKFLLDLERKNSE